MTIFEIRALAKAAKKAISLDTSGSLRIENYRQKESLTY